MKKITETKPFEQLDDDEAGQISKETGFDIDIIKTRFDYYNGENYLLRYVGTTRKEFISLFKIWFDKSLRLG